MRSGRRNGLQPLSMHCAAGSVVQLYSVIRRSYLLNISLAGAEGHASANLHSWMLSLSDEGVSCLRRGPQWARQLHVGHILCRSSELCPCPTKALACNETCCAKHTITWAQHGADRNALQGLDPAVLCPLGTGCCLSCYGRRARCADNVCTGSGAASTGKEGALLGRQNTRRVLQGARPRLH